MTLQKPPPNWEEIETRFVVNWETPAEIAKDYKTTANQISRKATQYDWIKKRKEIGSELRSQETDRRKRIFEKVGRIVEKMLDNIDNDLPNMGATVQDGEGFPNKYHADTWKALVSSYVKPDEDDSPSGQKMPDININFLRADGDSSPAS